MKLVLPILLGASLALSAQIPTKEELKAKADAAVDAGKAKADAKTDQAKAKADQKASDAKAKVDAKAGGVPVAGDKVKAATAKGEGAAKTGHWRPFLEQGLRPTSSGTAGRRLPGRIRWGARRSGA